MLPLRQREQAAKRAREEGICADRLSALPDGLLHAIMSFLPAPQAVKTSVLSQRWRHLWRTAPCVNIDAGAFGLGTCIGSNRGDLKQKWRKFEDFTNSLLLFRSGTVSLDKFRLYANNNCLRVCDVDRWVRRGIMYCPQVLEVLTPCIRGGSFLFPRLGASSCRLKRLHLNGVHLDCHFAEQIKSGCPLLEELELRNCIHMFQKINSCSLKSLIMDTLGNATEEHFVITAPCLEYFQMTVSCECYANGISVHAAESLLKAFVRLRCHGRTFSLKNQQSLLVDLYNVPYLELRGFQTKAMLIDESDKFPIFCNKQTLSLAECVFDTCDLYDKLDALGSFLQNAPCLRKLILHGRMFRVDGLIVRKSIRLPHQDRKTFQCPNLKSVEVISEANYDNQLIELLWGIGRMLPNATVTLTNF